MEAGADSCIYPVNLMARGRNIWIAWRSSDEPSEVLLKRSGAILHADTKLDLIMQCRSLKEGLYFEDDVSVDLDSLLARLVNRLPVSGDELINCWNMLIDIRGSLDPAASLSFDFIGGKFLESYDRFFSSTAGADMINFGFHDVRDVDMINAADVISSGVAMILSVVDNSLRKFHD